ncbi:MAG: hypothetical protein OXC28_07365 [Defluviicoccus sp.]|nr:hypothetical protein [Defluviicoccus sp.]
MSGTKYAMVLYRKLVREGAGIASGKALSGAIRQALDRQHPGGELYRKNWQLSLTVSPDDPNQQRLANNVHTDAESAFGTLCAFTPGDLQILIDANTAPGGSADVNELIAPAGNEFLKGMAYWLVVGDHCYIVQHVAVRTKAFEEYLTWFLRDAQAISAQGAIVLQTAFDAASVGGDLDNVQSIQIGGVVPETVEPADAKAPSAVMRTLAVDVRETLGRERPEFGKSMNILTELFGTIGAQEILAKVPSEAFLEVLVSIGYRAKRRKMDRSSMKDIATSLRNIDDGEVTVRSKDGRVRGNTVWLQQQMPFALHRPDGNLLVLEDARKQLMRVHRRFLEDGKIN